MKTKTGPCNIFETVFPFYCILKIVGFLPFSFVGPVKKGNFVISLCGFLYCGVVVCLHFGMIAFCYFRSFKMFKLSMVLRQGAQLELVGNIFIAIITVAIQTYKQKKIQIFLEILHKFDLAVSSFSDIFDINDFTFL